MKKWGHMRHGAVSTQTRGTRRWACGTRGRTRGTRGRGSFFTCGGEGCDGGVEFLIGEGEFLVGGDAVVPFGDVLHETYAFAFDGVGDDDAGFVFRRGGEGGGELSKIVAVDNGDFPAEGGEFFVERFVAANVAGAAGDLEGVVIDDGDEVVEAIVRGGHGGFPVGSFGEFAIAEEDEGAEVASIFSGGDGATDADGEAVAEAAGVVFAAGNGAGRMSDEGGVVLAEGVELFEGEKTFVGEDDVEGFDGVAFGLDVAVAVGVGEVLWGDVEDAVVEDVEDVDAGEAAAGVAGVGLLDDAQHGFAVEEGFEGEVLRGEGHGGCSLGKDGGRMPAYVASAGGTPALLVVIH